MGVVGVGSWAGAASRRVAYREWRVFSGWAWYCAQLGVDAVVAQRVRGSRGGSGVEGVEVVGRGGVGWGGWWG